jgi:hypothetical protein
MIVGKEAFNVVLRVRITIDRTVKLSITGVNVI